MEKHTERVHCTYSFIDICIFHLYSLFSHPLYRVKRKKKGFRRFESETNANDEKEVLFRFGGIVHIAVQATDYSSR